MKSVPHIEWWVSREPSTIHLALIKEGLRRYKYFRGAKLTVRTDSRETTNTVLVTGGEEIRPSEFLRMVEEVTS